MNFVWSLTKWRDYEACPLMAHNKHVLRNFVDKPSPALENGRRVHKLFEESVKHGVQLPPEFAHWEIVLEAFEGREDVFTEFKFGLTKDLKRCGFFDGDVWIRFVLDVFVTDYANPLIIDYKTGRFRDHHKSDAEFYGASAVVGYNFPQIPTQYWYVDNPESSFAVPMRAYDAKPLMARWRDLFLSAEMAWDQGKMPAEKGMACKYCQVKTCANYRGGA